MPCQDDLSEVVRGGSGGQHWAEHAKPDSDILDIFQKTLQKLDSKIINEPAAVLQKVRADSHLLFCVLLPGLKDSNKICLWEVLSYGPFIVFVLTLEGLCKGNAPEDFLSVCVFLQYPEALAALQAEATSHSYILPGKLELFGAFPPSESISVHLKEHKTR